MELDLLGFNSHPSWLDMRRNSTYSNEPRPLSSTRESPPIDPAINRVGKQTARKKDLVDVLQGDVLDEDCTALEGLEALTMKAIFEDKRRYLDLGPSQVKS